MNYKIVTWCRLGLKNAATVAVYRLLIKIGYYRYKLPVSYLPEESYFSDLKSDKVSRSKVAYFSFHSIEVASPPDWFLNPWNGVSAPIKKSIEKTNKGLINSDPISHWSSLSDFDNDVGDIKLVWELSRFDWLPKLAWSYRQGENNSLQQLELWVRDWVKQNPVNAGINWKCGQEASLRCLNLILASLLIDNDFKNPHSGYLLLLEAHISRVEPTFLYAMAQDNNHGTSEAAALFIVGEYLILHGLDQQKAKAHKWAKKGRFWIENRIHRLVMNDGSFSQHSLTYHRLFLDSLSFVELMKTKFGAKEFSSSFYRKMEAASTWLYYMTDRVSGDAPNLGANDGAYLFNLNDAEYRDFRPSVQLAAATFLKKSFLYENEYSHPLIDVFNINIEELPPIGSKPSMVTMPNGGYAVLTTESSFALIRLPIYKFRPSHADALHIDLWVNGENLLVDDGSYSYNTDADADADASMHFGGTASHNTIQFDDRDQMPRLSRFLFGSWLNGNYSEKKAKRDEYESLIASYTDYQGAHHHRMLELQQNKVIVTDTISGFKNKAVLRWRLPKGEWQKNGATIDNGVQQLKVICNTHITKFRITTGWVSRYYMKKTPIKVLEIEISDEAELITEFSWM